MQIYNANMNLAKNNFKFSPKFFIGLFLCLLVRLIPFRAPNIEPILATTMPISRAYGAVAGFSFAALSILLTIIFPGSVVTRIIISAGFMVFAALHIQQAHGYNHNKYLFY